MRSAIGLLTAGILLPALLCGADPAARCRLAKGLYEDRLTTIQKRGSSEGPATGELPESKLAAIDEEYRQFLIELSEAAARRDTETIKACCDQAANDRAGALFCELSIYTYGGRADRATFLDLFPAGKKDTTVLLDLDSIAGGFGRRIYPPKGPSYKLIDELFLLVMDERDTAMIKYFNLASHATGDVAAYMDGQITIFLKEAPAAVVNQWLVLRRYRPRLKTAAQSLIARSSPAEMQTVLKAVRVFCDKSNPDCPDILKLYAGK